MNNAVEVIHPDFPPQSSGVSTGLAHSTIVTPMDMLATAVSRGADIATIERLAALAERMESQRARREFDEAISAFKAEAPTVIKAREIKHGEKLISKYEDMAAISKVIDPVLAKYGLSYRFRTEALDKAVRVTCIISHRSGHSEETSLSGPHDASGAKNAIQGIGSSVTYLQRYTLKAALGLAASEDDDAKQAGQPEGLSDEQADEIEELIVETGGTISGFLGFKRIANVRDIPASQFEATKMEIRAIAKRRAERANG